MVLAEEKGNSRKGERAQKFPCIKMWRFVYPKGAHSGQWGKAKKSKHASERIRKREALSHTLHQTGELMKVNWCQEEKEKDKGRREGGRRKEGRKEI